MGFFMMALASSEAPAQTVAAAAGAARPAAISAAAVDTGAKPLGQATTVYVGGKTAVAATPAVRVAPAVGTVTGTIVQAQPARSVSVDLAPEIAREAALLYRNG